jgi:hypothetical protein
VREFAIYDRVVVGAVAVRLTQQTLETKHGDADAKMRGTAKPALTAATDGHVRGVYLRDGPTILPIEPWRVHNWRHA